MMKRTKSAADFYLSMCPNLHRWMNTCVTCGRRGYKPGLPDDIYPPFNVAATNLRAMFEPFALDGNGTCDMCTNEAKNTR